MAEYKDPVQEALRKIRDRDRLGGPKGVSTYGQEAPVSVPKPEDPWEKARRVIAQDNYDKNIRPLTGMDAFAKGMYDMLEPVGRAGVYASDPFMMAADWPDLEAGLSMQEAAIKEEGYDSYLSHMSGVLLGGAYMGAAAAPPS